MIRAREFQPFKILARSRWWCLVSTNFLNGCWRNAGKWRKRTLNNSKSKESITISNIGQVLLHIPCDVRALILNYSNRIDINFHSSVCQLQVIAEGRWLQTMLREGSAAGCFLQPFYSMEGERFVSCVNIKSLKKMCEERKMILQSKLLWVVPH